MHSTPPKHYSQPNAKQRRRESDRQKQRPRESIKNIWCYWKRHIIPRSVGLNPRSYCWQPKTEKEAYPVWHWTHDLPNTNLQTPHKRHSQTEREREARHRHHLTSCTPCFPHSPNLGPNDGSVVEKGDTQPAGQHSKSQLKEKLFPEQNRCTSPLSAEWNVQ